MRISEQVLATGRGGDLGVTQVDAPQVDAPRDDAARDEEAGGDWSEQTRRVLTRDLLVRASRTAHGEGQALRFRALHLNLHLVAVVADRLGLNDAERARVEYAALDGLHEAVRLFDPYDEGDFAAFATPFVERQLRLHLR